MKVVNESTQRVRPSMFLHGLTGSGKSTWATTGGTPLVILTEPKAESVLRQLNPNAVGLVPESLDDLEQLLQILGNPEKTAKFDRIILDSFTELTLASPRWIQARAGRSGVLAKLELSEFGQLRDYALAVVKAIQLTGLPSIIIGRSTSKRVGLVERIVPDGMGKSVEELPGKLLPTAEARFDPELGYVIDTAPADHSQRCGLPWLPAVYQGSCLDYLRLIEAGPQGAKAQPQATSGPTVAAALPLETADALRRGETVPAFLPAAPEPPALPGADDPEFVDLVTQYAASVVSLPEDERKAAVNQWHAMYAEDPAAAKAALLVALKPVPAPAAVPKPEDDPKGYQQAFGQAVAEDQAEKVARDRAKGVSPEASAFVDGVSPEVAKPEEITALMDACTANKVNTDSLWKYAVAKGQALQPADGSKNWNSLSKSFVSIILGQLAGANRAAFCAWLPKTYPPK